LLTSELLKQSAAQLSKAGVLSPEVDSELLAAHILGITRSELSVAIAMDSEFPEDRIGAFSDWVSRRANREPLQHITGLAPFRHLELAVGKGVFTPRPETEQVVSFAIEKIASFENPVIVDLCAGSGAIALSFATERPDATVYAVEKSKEAFEFLKQNSNKYGLDLGQLSNVDLQDCLTEMESVADLVISNPPYIPNRSIPVDLEVQLHEPAISLYGGVDGLDVIRQILSKAKQLLRTGGLLVIEHADTQSASIRELLLAEGWISVDSKKDLAGKDRMIAATKQK
jgi:release factor glutamine methyltransferase